MSIEIKVTKEYDGVKPKNFLKKKIDVPFFKVVNLISDKRITLNGKKIKQDDVLHEGDVIKIWPHDISLRDVKKYHENMEDLGIDVIYENADFIVFNKLPGIVVQGAQHDNKSISLHLAWHKNKIGDLSDFEYFHAHRIDKDTSGLLVVAKTAVSIRDLNEIFRERGVVKKYICLCVGEFDKKEGEIDVFLKRTEEGVREKVKVCKTKEGDAKKSLSYYKVVGEFEYKDEILSLVEVEIKTGITHQIRVHMKYLGHPIVGDKMYGNSSVNRLFEGKLDRHFLHASHLEFEYNGEKYVFDAPLTKDLENFMKNLRKY